MYIKCALYILNCSSVYSFSHLMYLYKLINVLIPAAGVSTQDLLEAGNAQVMDVFSHNTRRMYISAQKQFMQFCNEHSRNYLPCDRDTLLMYVSYMHYIKHMTVQTIKVYLAAIRAMHVTEGLQNPTDSIKIQLALKAIEMHSGAVQKNMELHMTFYSSFMVK